MPARCRSNRCRGSGPINTTASWMAGRIGPGRHPSRHRLFEERRFAQLHGRNGRLVGVLGLNRPRHVMQYKTMIQNGVVRGRGRRRDLAGGDHCNGARCPGRVAALVDWWSVARERLGVEFIAKPLVVIGLIGAALAVDTGDGVVQGLVVAALGASLVGDVVLMTPTPGSRRAFRLPRRACGAYRLSRDRWSRRRRWGRRRRADHRNRVRSGAADHRRGPLRPRHADGSDGLPR